MSLCTEWTIVKDTGDVRRARPLYCRSWSCEVCQPRRRSQLMAKASAGLPTRFLTLTVNPSTGESPYDRLRALSAAWNVLVKRIRRANPGKQVEYLAIVEETKRGEPHLHILLRSPFIAQKFISDAMEGLIGAPIVDIRKIRSMKEVVRYVAKYVTKAPAQFGTAKRYWCSTGYEFPADNKAKEVVHDGVRWHIDRRPINEVISEWIWQGFAPRKQSPGEMVAFRVRSPASRVLEEIDHAQVYNPNRRDNRETVLRRSGAHRGNQAVLKF